MTAECVSPTNYGQTAHVILVHKSIRNPRNPQAFQTTREASSSSSSLPLDLFKQKNTYRTLTGREQSRSTEKSTECCQCLFRGKSIVLLVHSSCCGEIPGMTPTPHEHRRHHIAHYSRPPHQHRHRCQISSPSPQNPPSCNSRSLGYSTISLL